MNLLIDVGNTRLKWATYQDGRIGEIQSAAHGGIDLGQELQSAWLRMGMPTRVTMASVVPGPIVMLRSWIRRHWGVPLDEVAVTAEAFGIRCGYSQPTQLGVDRWAAVIGARALSQGDLCVVDCGTAITVDGLNRDNQHRGGFIMPGLGLMRRTLALGTGSLPDVIRRRVHGSCSEYARRHPGRNPACDGGWRTERLGRHASSIGPGRCSKDLPHRRRVPPDPAALGHRFDCRSRSGLFGSGPFCGRCVSLATRVYLHDVGRYDRGFKWICAGVAQLVEQLICNQQVAGSTPVASSIFPLSWGQNG